MARRKLVQQERDLVNMQKGLRRSCQGTKEGTLPLNTRVQEIADFCFLYNSVLKNTL